MRNLFVLFLFPFVGMAQFAPPAGQAGTTAIYKDSSVFIHWSASCRVSRGPQDISNPSGGYPTVGDSTSAVGIADNSVVSLGDGGYAVCTFQYPIMNGTGADFAVFENSFSDDYLEFGFVEVSSDGVYFVRFPSTSNIIDTVQTASFGTCDARLVNNLGGKYRALYGTPFDLQELAGSPGLDVNNVTHVRIIDAVGSISSSYATYDNNSHKVNDPWPTPFASSGFDLDAVGVIHDITNGVSEHQPEGFSLYPNPASTNSHFKIESRERISDLSIINLQGENLDVIMEKTVSGVSVSVSKLSPGVYFIRVQSGKSSMTKKLIISE